MSNSNPASPPPDPYVKAKLDKSDPVGWYLCQDGPHLKVLHWDGETLDDTLPHYQYQTSYTRTCHQYATNFKGPMVFVDIDFP